MVQLSKPQVISCICLKSSVFHCIKCFRRINKHKTQTECNSPFSLGNRVCHLINKWVLCGIIFHLSYARAVSSLASVINKQCICPKIHCRCHFLLPQTNRRWILLSVHQNFFFPLTNSASQCKLNLLNVNVKLRAVRDVTGIYRSICHLLK